MSFDGIVTYAAAKEFRDRLSMGKIEKIYQPQPEQLLFIIHTKQGKQRLFISSAGNHSAAYLVDKTPENPVNPPVFCMVLRKHLSAARITDILQFCLHIRKAALCFDCVDLTVILKNRNAGRIIAPVFELFQTVDQNIGGILVTDITYNTAHKLLHSVVSTTKNNALLLIWYLQSAWRIVVCQFYG